MKFFFVKDLLKFGKIFLENFCIVEIYVCLKFRIKGGVGALL